MFKQRLVTILFGSKAYLVIVSTAFGIGNRDIDSIEAIAFDPYTHGYYKVNGRVGEAFKDGLRLK